MAIPSPRSRLLAVMLLSAALSCASEEAGAPGGAAADGAPLADTGGPDAPQLGDAPGPGHDGGAPADAGTAPDEAEPSDSTPPIEEIADPDGAPTDAAEAPDAGGDGGSDDAEDVVDAWLPDTNFCVSDCVDKGACDDDGCGLPCGLCPLATCSADQDVSCGETVTLAPHPSAVATYKCGGALSTGMEGPEAVLRFVAQEAIILQVTPGDGELFILSGASGTCDPTACVAADTDPAAAFVSTVVPAGGVAYIVMDTAPAEPVDTLTFEVSCLPIP